MLSRHRWLIRRLQGVASIRCDSYENCAIDHCALLPVMAKLSGAFTKGTDVAIDLIPGAVLACRLAAWGFAVLPRHICERAGFAKDP